MMSEGLADVDPRAASDFPFLLCQSFFHVCFDAASVCSAGLSVCLSRGLSVIFIRSSSSSALTPTLSSLAAWRFFRALFFVEEA